MSTSPAAASCLTIARDDGVLRLTKTNPKSGYGISIAMWQALTAAFEGARVDPSVRAIVIDAGGRGFHRGAVMVTELQPELAKLGKADFRNLVQMGQSLGRLIASMSIPVIGIARAGALGGGLELLLRCDFLYTVDAAEFSFPEVTLGFVAAWGGTQWGARMMPFRKAQEMLLLGEKISGRRAEEINLVTRSFADISTLDRYVTDLLARLRLCSPASFAGTKQCLSAVWAGPLDHGERVELECEADAMGSGQFLASYDSWTTGGAYDYYADAPKKE